MTPECECGNTDWQQFLYVSDGPGLPADLAGCKRCGRVYERTPAGAWVKIAEPPHPVPVF